MTYSQIGLTALALAAVIGIFAWIMVAGSKQEEDEMPGYVNQDDETEWWTPGKTDMRYWDGSDWASALDHSAPEKTEGTPSPDDWKRSAVKGHHPE